MPGDEQQTSDEQLAAEAQDGSLEAFGSLVDRYHARVYHFLCHKTANPEDAQDVTQQVFIRAWQKIHQFRVEAKFATWLFTITRRAAINYYRARKALGTALRRPDVNSESSQPTQPLLPPKLKHEMTLQAGVA